MMSFMSLDAPPSQARSDAHPAPPAQLSEVPGWAMFLDLDGTLCPYLDTPDDVRLDGAQREILRSLALRLDGALCVLSGRASDDLDRALGDLSIARCGEHGHGRREGLPVITLQELGCAEEALRAMASLFAADGVWMERKMASCAIHYRRAPQLAECLIRATRAMAESYPQLRLMEGQCVIELASRHSGKGHALRRLMHDAPFRGRVSVAVGDDVTDEDAFVAATALGGFGVCVGTRDSVAARYRLSDSAAVNAWLQGLASTPSEVLHG